MLGDKSFDIVEFTASRDALNFLRSEKVSLILSDVELPEMDGLSFAAVARNLPNSKNTPIIFLTAIDSSSEVIERAYELGAIDFIFKPIDPKLFKSKINVIVSFYQEVASSVEKEKNLRTEEENLRNKVLDSALDAVIGIDQDQNIIDWNPQAEKIFGWRKDEVLGKKLPDVIIPLKYRNMHIAGMKKFLETGDGPVLNKQIEVDALRRSGDIFPVELTVVPIQLGHKFVFYSFLRDISLRIATEKEKENALIALRRNENNFRTLANSIPQLAWMANPDGHIFWYNEQWYKYTGKTESEMEGWGWQSVHHPDELPRVLEFWKHSLSTGEVFELEFPIRDAAGIYRWFLTRVLPVKDDKGNVTRWFGTNTNIDALQRSQAQLQAIFGAMHDGVAVFDMDANLILLNDALAKNNGFSSQEEMKKNLSYFSKVYELRYPDGRVAPVEEWPISRVMRGESVPKLFMWGKRKDTGQEWYFNFSGEPIFDNAGKQILSVIIARDITESKLAEIAIEQSEAKFRQLSNAIPQIVWATNAQGDKIDFYNERWFQYTGITEHSSDPSIWDIIVHPDDMGVISNAWERSLNEKIPLEAEVRLRGKNDSYRWFLMQTIHALDEKGNTIRWIGTCTDIGDQKKRLDLQTFLAEASSTLSSSLDYKTTLKKVSDLAILRLADWCGVDVPDENGDLQLLSISHREPEKVQLARDLRKKYPMKMDGKNGVPSVMRTGKSEFFPDIPEELLEQSAQDDVHLKILRELGLRSAIIVPIKAGDKILGTISLIGSHSSRKYDETDLRFAEELGIRAGLSIENALLYSRQVKAREDEEHLVAELQKTLEARDEFLSIASHELKTPLTSLRLQVELFKYLSAAQPIQEAVTKSLRYVDSLSSLIDVLLDVTRMRNSQIDLNCSDVDISKIATECAERYRTVVMNSGAKLNTNIPTAITCYADQVRVQQVMENLLSNAVKYGKGKDITFDVSLSDKRVEICVSDKGVGIAQSDHARIFAKFERAVPSQNFGGLGLGLYVVKEIMDAHGGAVDVKSTPGEGATFIAYFPCPGA